MIKDAFFTPSILRLMLIKSLFRNDSGSGNFERHLTVKMTALYEQPYFETDCDNDAIYI